MDLLVNSVENKVIELKTSSNIELYDELVVRVTPGEVVIKVDSDLMELK